MKQKNLLKTIVVCAVVMLTFCSCSSVILRWFVSHKYVSVESTAGNDQTVVQVTHARRPFTGRNSFKRKVYIDQSFLDDSLKDISEHLFTVIYGGEKIMPKVYLRSSKDEIRLKEPSSVLPMSVIHFTFNIDAKTNESIKIIEKDVPHKGDSTIINIGIAEPIEAMDDEDEIINYTVHPQSANYRFRSYISRPPLYRMMSPNQNENVQDFAVEYLSSEMSPLTMTFIYEGDRYRLPMKEECVEMIQQLKQGDNIKIQIKFFNCIVLRYNDGSLPSAIIERLSI